MNKQYAAELFQNNIESEKQRIIEDKDNCK